MEIKDRARRFYGVADNLGASGEAVFDELLVFVHQPLQLTLLCGDSVEGLDVEETQPFNVYRSTILDTSALISGHVINGLTERHTLSVLW